MIKVENLKKVFRSEDIEIETIALDGVSFEINDGEFVAIMGPSGCGKSTLLNILGLLDNPTEGKYELLGHQVGDLKEKDRTQFRKGNIGFVFQSFNLIDELNVFENIELPLRYMNIPAAERKQRVEDIMTRMAIKHRASRAWPSSTAPRTSRSSCRAVSSKGWPSPAPSSPTQSSSSPTNPRVTSTRRTARR